MWQIESIYVSTTTMSEATQLSSVVTQGKCLPRKIIWHFKQVILCLGCGFGGLDEKLKFHILLPKYKWSPNLAEW